MKPLLFLSFFFEMHETDSETDLNEIFFKPLTWYKIKGGNFWSSHCGKYGSVKQLQANFKRFTGRNWRQFDRKFGGFAVGESFWKSFLRNTSLGLVKKKNPTPWKTSYSYNLWQRTDQHCNSTKELAKELKGITVAWREHESLLTSDHKNLQCKPPFKYVAQNRLHSDRTLKKKAPSSPSKTSCNFSSSSPHRPSSNKIIYTRREGFAIGDPRPAVLCSFLKIKNTAYRQQRH